jgi:hypothetical protein
MKFKLDVTRDVSIGDDSCVLVLPLGWRFDDELIHVRTFDTLKDLRTAARTKVIPCDCYQCKH